jgi:hypothetical protein
LKFAFLFEKSIAFLHPNLDWLSCFGPVPEDFDAVQVAFVVVGKLFLQTLKPSVKVSEIKMFTNYNFYKFYFFPRLGYLVTDDSIRFQTYYQQLLQIIVKPVYNDHPWDPKVVTVVDRWSLFSGSFKYSV